MQIEPPPERLEALELQVAEFFSHEPNPGALLENPNPYTFRILTVCTGNVCRSPLAEALLRDRLTDAFSQIALPSEFLTVDSLGLGALVGAEADPPVRELALALGADLGAHVARQFEPGSASGAHLILTATHEQRAAVARLAPVTATRTFTLLEFARLLSMLSESGALAAPMSTLHRPSRLTRHLQRTVADVDAARGSAGPASSGADDVDDPYQCDPDVHRRVARTIDDAVYAIAAILGTVVRP